MTACLRTSASGELRVHSGLARQYAVAHQNHLCGVAVGERRITAILLGSLIDDAGSAAVPADGGAERLLKAYSMHGVAVGATLAGAFNAVIIDEEQTRILLINDVAGSFLQYWHRGNGQFVFASSVKTVVRGMRASAELDLRAVADYMHFGLVFGTKTLVAGIELVPPGTTLIFDWTTQSLQQVVNRRPAELFEPLEQTRQGYHESVRVAFNESVRRACRDAPSLGLSLSGGLDSRAILSAIPALRGRVRSYTVGVRLCADDTIAKKLSRLADTDHYFLELGDQYLRDFLPNLDRMVALTDGMYLSHGLTEVLALKAVQESGMKTLLRGHCGELAKTSLAWPFHTDNNAFTMTPDSFARYFFERVNYISRGVSVSELFASDLQEQVAGAAGQSFNDTIQAARGLSPADICSYVYLTEHHRRCTIQSIALFRESVDVRMPFADERFLRVLLGGRPEWRAGTELHRNITGTNAPRLLRVRNSNTGVPGSAGPLVERLFDPVNSVLKRLNAPGYRHYHRFDAWMRSQLVASIKEVLFDAVTINRGVFNHGKVRALLDEMQSGQADHAYLLQILLILELWQRQVSSSSQAA